MEQHAYAAVLFNFQWIVDQAGHNNGSIVVFVSALQKLNMRVAHKDDKFFGFVSVLIC